MNERTIYVCPNCGYDDFGVYRLKTTGQPGCPRCQANGNLVWMTKTNRQDEDDGA